MLWNVVTLYIHDISGVVASMCALDQRTTSFTFDSEQRWAAWSLLEEFVASCRYHNSSKKRPGQMPHCEQSPSYSLHEDEALVRYLGVLWSGGGGEPEPFISLTHTMLIKYACDTKQGRHPNVLDTQAWNLTFQRERSTLALLSLSHLVITLS